LGSEFLFSVYTGGENAELGAVLGGITFDESLRRTDGEGDWMWVAAHHHRVNSTPPSGLYSYAF